MVAAVQPKSKAPLVGASICLSLAVLSGLAGMVVGLTRAEPAGDRETSATAPSATPTSSSVPSRAPAGPVLDPAARQAGSPRRTGLASELERALSARSLGPHVGVAVRDADGSLLYGSGDGDPYIPASTTKVITAAAALAALGPRHTFDTTVVEGAQPHEIVLVGGGDPMLVTEAAREQSAENGGDRAAFAHASTLEELAARTADRLAEAGGDEPVRLGFDDSLFEEGVSPLWRDGYLQGGHVAPVSALVADQARTAWPERAPRAKDPAEAAARAFAAALAAEGVEVEGEPERTTAPVKAPVLASVESLTVAEIVEHMLLTSDNDAAEMLARHVAVAEDRPATFEGAAEAVRAVLGRLGTVDVDHIGLHDGSGLSRSNRLTPSVLTQVLAAAADPAHPRLRPLLTGLPVAAFTGSLSHRFHEDGADVGAGVVRAKTGTLSGVSSLAGVVTTEDGRVLTFAVLADHLSTWAEPDLDRIAAILAGCRCGR